VSHDTTAVSGRPKQKSRGTDRLPTAGVKGDDRPVPRAHRPLVETLEARELLTVFLVQNTNDSGDGSLRQAIIDANRTAGQDTISFDISPPGQQTIDLLSQLPEITDPVAIDGTTQPGFDPLNPRPMIELNGTGAGTLAAGLVLGGLGGNSVRGLVINRFQGPGIEIVSGGSGAVGNLVQGNFIGTDAAGTAQAGNGDGILISLASDNTIGGAGAGQGNLISGNTGDGITINDQGGIGSRNTIVGNLIGVDVTGSQDLGNGGNGVSVIESDQNTIGGTATGMGNVISGNSGDGISLSGSGAVGNLVQGNFIGTDAAGTVNLGNTGNGVSISGFSNSIGGTVDGARNIIAFSGGDAVVVDTGTGNAIVSNSIHDNSGGGIVLVNGGNDDQVAPTLTDALVFPDRTQIDGTFTIAAGTGYLVQFFGNDPASGQGRTLLGQQEIAPQASGATIPVSLITNPLPLGSTVTAVAIVTSTPLVEVVGPTTGDTSAFSASVFAVNPFIVTNTSASGVGSLPFAVQTANTDVGNDDTITFQIPTNDIGYDAATGAWTIFLNTTLTINKPPQATTQHTVFIDALSQQGQPGANTTHPAVAIAPGQGFDGSDGVAINSPGNTVRGLAIGEFTGRGIVIAGSGATGNLISGNYIGTDVTGELARPNGGPGIQISTSGNTIGGTTSQARNLISANRNDGITIGNSVRIFPTGNLVQGNFIGTDATGALGLGNSAAGVRVFGSGNTIGGAVAGAANVISGNSSEGMFIRGNNNAIVGNLVGTDVTGTRAIGNGLSGLTLQGSNGNLIQGNILSGNGSSSRFAEGLTISGPRSSQNLVVRNLIGTDATGTRAIPNQGPGIALLNQADQNTIGGSSPGSGNVISGNRFEGIHVIGSAGNEISGNLIGLSAQGNAAIANGTDGIFLDNSGSNLVRLNVISGNGQNLAGGILLAGSSTSSNLIQANRIGTDATGTFAIGNHNDGIRIVAGAASNTIGGGALEVGNVISGNGNHGIEIGGPETVNNVVAGNLVGLNAGGNAALGNTVDGLFINDASGTTVGPLNVFSGNGVNGDDGAGIELEGTNTRDMQIFGNKIGTDPGGLTAIGNSLHGIFVGNGVSNVGIGPNNVISGNGQPTNQGVNLYIFGTATTLIDISGNQIGTDVNGQNGLGNAVIGVLISQSPGNLVRQNVISGNRFIGVEIAGATASANQVRGNFIGTSGSGLQAVPNGFDGIFLNDAPNNLIGGTSAGQGNLISGNGSVGIQLFGPQTQGNIIQGNALGLDANGQPRLPNREGGLFVNTSPQANQIGGNGPGQSNSGQAFPHFTLSGFHQSPRRSRSHLVLGGRRPARPRLVARSFRGSKPH
jgi:parallel beta-helix repeat protein